MNRDWKPQPLTVYTEQHPDGSKTITLSSDAHPQIEIDEAVLAGSYPDVVEVEDEGQTVTFHFANGTYRYRQVFPPGWHGKLHYGCYELAS